MDALNAEQFAEYTPHPFSYLNKEAPPKGGGGGGGGAGQAVGAVAQLAPLLAETL